MSAVWRRRGTGGPLVQEREDGLIVRVPYDGRSLEVPVPMILFDVARALDRRGAWLAHLVELQVYTHMEIFDALVVSLDAELGGDDDRVLAALDAITGPSEGWLNRIVLAAGVPAMLDCDTDEVRRRAEQVRTELKPCREVECALCHDSPNAVSAN